MDNKYQEQDIFESNFKKIENINDCPNYLLDRVKYETIIKFDLYNCT